MNFTYSIDFHNKQTGTVTVVYTPETGVPTCYPVVQLVECGNLSTQTELHNLILSLAPIAQWERAVADAAKPDFELVADVAATPEDVDAAIAAMTPTPTLEGAKALKRYAIDQMREAAEQAGMGFVFPGEANDVVQLRDDRDRTNISSLTTVATILSSQGVSDPVLAFRAASDVTYDMTPAQMIELGLAVAAFVSETYLTAWGLKQQLDAAETIEAVEAISWP